MNFKVKVLFGLVICSALLISACRETPTDTHTPTEPELVSAVDTIETCIPVFADGYANRIYNTQSGYDSLNAWINTSKLCADFELEPIDWQRYTVMCFRGQISGEIDSVTFTLYADHANKKYLGVCTQYYQDPDKPVDPYGGVRALTVKYPLLNQTYSIELKTDSVYHE